MAFCLFDKLLKRGLISGIYPESVEYRIKLKELLSNGPRTVYTGFDATASSLHIGNLATLINLLHLQRHGHQVICVIGDATTLVGDPAGRSKERQRFGDKSVIDQNASNIEQTLNKLFKNFNSCFPETKVNLKSSILQPIIVRNSLWYSDKNVVDFVGDVFREVRVGGLLHKKSIQERLQSREGMNMSEFCYQIFQAYDWLELRRRYNCQLQIGGADQGGNIYTGHDLIKKRLRQTDSIGLLAPLITSGKTGKKLGKSTDKSSSSIWLREEQTSPFDLYQFFHRTPDCDVEKFLKVFSFYEEEVIADLIENYLKKPDDIWFCQHKLAEHACMLVHGKEGLDIARRKTNELFPSSRKIKSI